MAYPLTAPENAVQDAFTSFWYPDGWTLARRYYSVCEGCDESAVCPLPLGLEITNPITTYITEGSQLEEHNPDIVAEYVLMWQRLMDYMYWLAAGQVGAKMTDPTLAQLISDRIDYQYHSNGGTSEPWIQVHNEYSGVANVLDADKLIRMRAGRGILYYGRLEYKIVRTEVGTTYTKIYVNRPVYTLSGVTQVSYYEDKLNKPSYEYPHPAFKTFVDRVTSDWYDGTTELTLGAGRIAYPVQWSKNWQGTFRVWGRDLEGIEVPAPMIHWKCNDDASSNTVVDSSGNGWNGELVDPWAQVSILTNAVADTGGKINNCFNATDPGLRASVKGPMDSAFSLHQFTATCWLRPNATGTPSNNKFLWGFGDYTDVTSPYDTEPHLRLINFGGSADYWLIQIQFAPTVYKRYLTSFPIESGYGDWMHIAWTCSDTSTKESCKIYVNGEEVAESSEVGVWDPTTELQGVSFGCLYWGLANNVWPNTTYYDDLRFYDENLDIHQIQEIYNSGHGTDDGAISQEAGEGVDITAEVLEGFPGADSRVHITNAHGWASTLDAIQDIGPYDGYQVEYCEEVTPGSASFKPTEMKCHNCKRDFTESLGHARTAFPTSLAGMGSIIDSNDRHWFCKKLKTASHVQYFSEECYETDCDRFQLNVPWAMSSQAWANLLFARHNYLISEKQGPYWYYTGMGTAGQPSLMFLAGMPCPTNASIGATERWYWPAGHDADGAGGVWGELVHYSNPDSDNGEIDVVEYGSFNWDGDMSTDPDGIIAHEPPDFVNQYKTWLSLDRNSLTEFGDFADVFGRVNYFFNPGRIASGIGMGHPLDRPYAAEHQIQGSFYYTQVRMPEVQFGVYQDFGNYVWNADATFEIKEIRRWGRSVWAEHADRINSISTVVANKVIKMDFYPGIVNTSYADGGGGTGNLLWLTCGMTVTPPPDKMITNPGAALPWMSYIAGLHHGCVVTISGTDFPYQDVGFTCIKAMPFSGSKWTAEPYLIGKGSANQIYATTAPDGPNVPDWYATESQRLSMDEAWLSLDSPRQVEAYNWIVAHGLPSDATIKIYVGPVLPPKWDLDGINTNYRYRVIHKALTGDTLDSTEILIEDNGDFEVDRPSGKIYDLNWDAHHWDPHKRHCVELKNYIPAAPSFGGWPYVVQRRNTHPAQLYENFTRCLERCEWYNFGSFGSTIFLDFTRSLAPCLDRGNIIVTTSPQHGINNHPEFDFLYSGDLILVTGDDTRDSCKVGSTYYQYGEQDGQIHAQYRGIKVLSSDLAHSALYRMDYELVAEAKIDIALRNPTYHWNEEHINTVGGTTYSVAETYEHLQFRLMALWIKENGDHDPGSGSCNYNTFEYQIGGFSDVIDLAPEDYSDDKWNTVDVTSLVRRALQSPVAEDWELVFVLGGVGPLFDSDSPFLDPEALDDLTANELFYASASCYVELNGASLIDEHETSGYIEYTWINFKNLKIKIDHHALRNSDRIPNIDLEWPDDLHL